MARSARSRPARTLLVLLGLIAALYGVVAAGVHWDKAQWTPKLALDLEGGTQIVLSPQPVGGQKTVDPTAVDQSVNIIRQRVNGSGISEAEVARQGEGSDTKIVVSLPGKPDKATVDLVERSAQLQFRALLVAQQTGVPLPSATPTGTPSPGATPKATPPGKASSSPPVAKPSGSSSGSSPSQSSNGGYVPKALRAATPSPTPTSKQSPAGGAAATPTPGAPTSPSAKPTSASDTRWVTPQLADQFTKLDCTKPDAVKALRSASPDPAKPFITCADDGREKYILGPAELVGTDVTGASASLETNSQGFSGTAYQVNLNFSSEGARKFGDVTSRLVGLTGDQNRFAIVLDNLVISAPTTQAAIRTGSAQITGNFTQQSATDLANQLKYGALPVSFRVETTDTITATLGNENLRNGLIAGLIGLGLVVLYSLLQYRALGLVTVASLVIAALVTYGLVVLLGWRQGYRLSLPGVAGLIVSVGITADSFIVYFERIRDEVREGRPLKAAVEAAWRRARRTILASDAISFLAAIVLYVLAIGNVRGFAFTLGLTTLVDVAVVFLFTKPMVTLLSRTRFFGGGHKLSGFDAEHLGRAVAYAGRGRTRGGGARPVAVRAGAGATIAERRAERERAAAADGEPAPDDPRLQQTTSGRDS